MKMALNVSDFVAGWAGGVSSLLVSHPFDTIKVRQQTYHCSFLTAVKDTYKYQGLTGFYKGILSPLITYGPSNSLFFGVYGNCFRLLYSEDAKHKDTGTDWPTLKNSFISGSAAGVVQTMFYSPVEFVKILLQSNTKGEGGLKKDYIPPYKTTYEAVAGIYKTRGIVGYYKGLWPMLVRDGPSGGLYMIVYELLRHADSRALDLLGNVGREIFAGGMSGVISIATMIPFDVVKTHIQTDNPEKPSYRGMLDCFRKLYASDGTKIFFKGLSATCYRAFPAHAVMFVVYEAVLMCFE